MSDQPSQSTPSAGLPGQPSQPSQPTQESRPTQSSQPSQPQPPLSSLPPPAPRLTAPVALPPAAQATPVGPQPSAFKRGFGLGAGAALGLGAVMVALSLISGLALTLLGAGMLAAGGGPVAGEEPVTTIWGDEGAGHTLRAVEINGAIMTDSSEGGLLAGGTYGYEIADMIDEIDADEADGLILRINTPGGTITGAKAIADAVERYQKRTGKKVLAHVQGLSASGGMYAMAGADKIVADYGSMVGSIGVIFGPFQRFKDVTAITGLLAGVETRGGITEFYLTQGKGKDAGNPYRDLTAEERKVFTDGLVHEYDAFVQHVSDKRGISTDTIKNDLGAHVFDNATAKTKGLIDETMGTDDAYAEAARMNGIDVADVKVVQAAAPSGFSQLLGASSRVLGQAPAATGPATHRICSGSPVVLVYSGRVSALCG